MRDTSALRTESLGGSPLDGWLGTRELPGYRAGNVVAKLADLPEVDSQHLYFDLLLLDPQGELRDNHSGPCFALMRELSVDESSLDERSRFVRVVAELVRHAPSQDRGLAAVGQALNFIRERGVEIERVVLAAQLLDDACSERAVVDSLSHILELLLGKDEAPRTMCDVVVKLARESGRDPRQDLPDLQQIREQQLQSDLPFEADVNAPESSQTMKSTHTHNDVRLINQAGLATQVSYLVRTVGKEHARRYLREATHIEIVPTPEILGV